jgi:Methyltransferase FkbM domain
MRLDSYGFQNAIGQCALVKIDVEGAEGLVLQGMKDGLASGLYRRVLIELHQQMLGGHSPASVFGLLSGPFHK